MIQRYSAAAIAFGDAIDGLKLHGAPRAVAIDQNGKHQRFAAGPVR